MKKRILSMVFMALAALALVGCNKKSDKIEITIGFWPKSTEARDVAMYELWAKQFMEDYPEYEIIGDPYEYDTKTIGSKYLNGTLPTVFQTWFTEPEKLKTNGYIRPVTGILEKYKWLECMDSEMKNQLTFDNEVYGIPRDGYGLGLLINMETFYQAGLIEKDANGSYIMYDSDNNPLYPTTFDQVTEWSATLSELSETKGILICSANKNGGWQLSNIAWNYGATLEYVDENNKVKANLNSKEMVDALEWIQYLKNNELLINNAMVYYSDWSSSIESKVGMAIVGSDVLQLAKTEGKVDMDKLAFVPMPTGNNRDHYSLYGGTPYVFNADATDEQVEGVIKFFEYIGRTPYVSEISKKAMVDGNETAYKKGQPILPTISPWVNPEYQSYKKQLEDEYVSVDMNYYQEFFNSIQTNKHAEVTYYAQEMYEFLDSAIQSVFTNDTANVKSLLDTANAKLQKLLDDNINK